jgi:hypothetical protein
MIKWIWPVALIGLACAQIGSVSEVKVENHEVAINSTAEKVKSEAHDIEKKNLAVLSTLPVLEKAGEPSESSSDNMPGSAVNPINPEKYIGSIDENGLFLKYNYVFLTIVSLSVVVVIVFKTHR